MRFVFISSGDFKEGNGSNSRHICYGKGLQSIGHDVKFYFLVPGEFSSTGINRESKGMHEGISFEYLCKRVRRPSLLIFRLFLLLRSWVNAFLMMSKLDRRNDVLYFFDPQAFIHGPVLLMARSFGFKTVIEKVELHSLAVENKRSFTYRIARFSYRIIEKNLHRLCDKLVVISFRLQHYYGLRYNSRDILKVPIVVDPKRFENLSNQDRTNTLGYIGSFGLKDGVGGILKAYAIARKSLPELKLRLIGYKIRDFDLDAAFHTAGLDPNDSMVEIVGQVKSAEIPQLLQSCDTLLLNRVNSPFANYGFPTKLGEYLMTGRPVIATDVSDISRYMQNEKDVLIIRPDDPALLATTIARRYREYAHYSSVGQKGRETALREFNYLPHLERIAQVCSELLVQKKPATRLALLGE